MPPLSASGLRAELGDTELQPPSFPRNYQPQIKLNDSVVDAAMHEAVPAIAALGVSPIVRIPDLQPWMVKREPFE